MIQTHLTSDFEFHLIQKLNTGSTEAFSQLSEYYRPCLYRIAVHIVHNQEDANDLVQETLVKAFKHYGNFSFDRPIRPWLTKICVNNCIDFVRSNHLTTLQQPFIIDGFVDSTGEVQNSIESDLTVEAVAKAIQSMPKRYQRILEMRLLQQRPISEIATELKTPEGTVKSWLFRGKILLRKTCLNSIDNCGMFVT